MTQFYAKTKICYGGDALEMLERVTARHAFIVTDPFMVRAGFVNQVKSPLERAGVSHSVFDGVEPDPSLDTVIKGTALFVASQADLLIALGGGSAIDTAKALSFFACKVRGGEKKAPLVAIPTTSGAGSEVTSISVITDKANGVKIPLNDEFLIPDIAVLDARFTRTVPPAVTAATGMDVLTHAIESRTSRSANAFTNIYANHAIRHVFAYLPRAYRCTDDMEAREKLLQASCMAGMAFANSGLGLTHGIAHSLGGLFHVPHGLANAVILPHVMRFNRFDVGAQYRELAEMLSLPAKTMDEGVDSLIEAVRDMNKDLGIPGSIRALRVEGNEFGAHLDVMARHALEDLCTGSNPRRPSHDDVKMILRQAW